VFECVGPALGSLVFGLIHQLTGGEWGRALRPFLLAGTRLLPWCWLLMVPLVISAVRQAGGGDGWHYLGAKAMALRAVGYGAVFFFLSSAMVRAWPSRGQRERLAWVGPAGIIGVLFMNHLLAGDWLAGLDEGWASTAFPVVWLVGQSVAGLAVAILAAILTGADPARALAPHRRLGIDWGTLLFAGAMTWCYVAFAQFLIVWSGDLPQETGWYTRRMTGAWSLVPLVSALLCFVVPLFVLLSRRAKQSRRALAIVAGLLLVAQLLQTAWLILPAFPGAPAAVPWLTMALVVGFGGVWVGRYLALTAKEEVEP
jgi:hypothetical protein